MTGGWAATNTLREEHLCPVDDYGDPLPDCPGCAALALVEAALDAAENDLRQDGYPIDDPAPDGRDAPRYKAELIRQWGAEKVASAAALRAVREGK